MAPINNRDITSTKTWYTFDEAVEYMKQRDREPTTGRGVSWKDKNGNPVSIGYTKW